MLTSAQSRFWTPLVAAALCMPGAHAMDLFVDANLASGASNGSTWADAFQGPDGLQAALGVAVAGDRIFVAQGTYRPSATGNRGTSFRLQLPVEIYGGFLGGESSPAERPPLGDAPTILSGDLAGDDPVSLTDNSFHVLFATVTAPGALLDGFVVSGGVADGSPSVDLNGGGLFCAAASRPLVRSCRFEGNRCLGRGGAVAVASGASPTFVACSFVGNESSFIGGALEAESPGTLLIDRCRFEANEAANGGALYLNFPGGVRISNSTFFDNVATGPAGGGAIGTGGIGAFEIRNSTLVANRATTGMGGGLSLLNITIVNIANCILWANEGPGSAGTLASQVSGNSMISYSIVQGIAPGSGNLDADPALVDLLGGDLRPSLASPAIDAGNNGALPVPGGSLVAVDRDGYRRFQDEPSVPDTGGGAAPIVDIGALEYATLIGRPLCAGAANSTGKPARLDALGALAASANDVTLEATSLPPHAFGYFLTSRDSAFVPNFEGSSGALCLGGVLGRLDGPGQVQGSGAMGQVSLVLDLTSLPRATGPVAVMAGETWHFQFWHRDATLGFATSNFTEAVTVTFE